MEKKRHSGHRVHYSFPADDPQFRKLANSETQNIKYPLRNDENYEAVQGSTSNENVYPKSFLRKVSQLNKQFYDSFVQSYKECNLSDFTPTMKDYINHMKKLYQEIETDPKKLTRDRQSNDRVNEVLTLQKDEKTFEKPMDNVPFKFNFSSQPTQNVNFQNPSDGSFKPFSFSQINANNPSSSSTAPPKFTGFTFSTSTQTLNLFKPSGSVDSLIGESNEFPKTVNMQPSNEMGGAEKDVSVVSQECDDYLRPSEVSLDEEGAFFNISCKLFVFVNNKWIKCGAGQVNVKYPFAGGNCASSKVEDNFDTGKKLVVVVRANIGGISRVLLNCLIQRGQMIKYVKAGLVIMAPVFPVLHCMEAAKFQEGVSLASYMIRFNSDDDRDAFKNACGLN